MNLAQIFANNVRIYRVMAGLTQKELAKLLDINQSKMSRLEKPQSSVSFYMAEKVAEALKIPASELFRSHQMTPE